MRRLLLFFVLLLISISIPLHAQLIKEYGIKLGINSSHHTSVTAINSDTYSSGSRTGFDIGGYVEMFKYKNINLLVELHYTQKGMKYNISDFGSNISGKGITSINYIMLPVLGKFTAHLRTTSAYFFLGPRFDILINYDDDILDGLYRNINRVNPGASFGIGLSNRFMNKFSVMGEFRYDIDIVPLVVTGLDVGTHHLNYGNEVSANWRNNSFTLLLGIGF